MTLSTSYTLKANNTFVLMDSVLKSISKKDRIKAISLKYLMDYGKFKKSKRSKKKLKIPMLVLPNQKARPKNNYLKISKILEKSLEICYQLELEVLEIWMPLTCLELLEILWNKDNMEQDLHPELPIKNKRKEERKSKNICWDIWLQAESCSCEISGYNSKKIKM